MGWARRRGNDRTLKRRQTFAKMGVDGFESPTYMAASPTGQGVLPNPVCVSLSRIPVPRIKLGGGTRRLFDIVGLDEGTCGRRLRSPAASRRWRIGKNKPFHGLIVRGLLQRSVLHVSLHIHSICEVQERLLESRP